MNQELVSCSQEDVSSSSTISSLEGHCHEQGLPRIPCAIIHEAEPLVFHLDPGPCCSASPIRTLAIVSRHVVLLPILRPGAVARREPWITCRWRQSRHGQPKLRMLLALRVRQPSPIPLAEENGSMDRGLNQRITLRGRALHSLVIYMSYSR